jgi:mannose-6-phosphate isomerase
MRRLHNRIREYEWGSREAIAAVQGRPVPSEAPEAELWVGAHPGNPSVVDGDGTLDSFIASAPSELLGADAVARFGARLPYLLKLLAASKPLSIQAHPDELQAAAGFAAEEAAGVPREAAHRSYVDPHHKPEMLVAWTDFEVLCGFRRPADSARLLAALEVAELAPVVAALARSDLRGAVSTLLTWPQEQRPGLVAGVVGAAGRLPAAQCELLGLLAKEFPGDLGIVVGLLLNHVTLRPGEAIWMPAGNMHSYLRGTGVEILAASDNVLRGGLTPKHVNVAELLKVLVFEPLDDPIVTPVEVVPGAVTWPAPIADFRLTRVRVAAAAPVGPLTPSGPRTVLCLAGTVTVTDGESSIELAAGEAAFGGAGGGSLTFAGAGEVFLASL